MSKIKAIDYNWYAHENGTDCERASINNALTATKLWDMNNATHLRIASEWFKRLKERGEFYDGIIDVGLGTSNSPWKESKTARDKITKRQFLIIFKKQFKEYLLQAKEYLKDIKEDYWSKEITKITESERFCEIFYLNGRRERVFNVNKIYYND